MSRRCHVLYHVETHQQFVQPSRVSISPILNVDVDVATNKNRARERDEHLAHRRQLVIEKRQRTRGARPIDGQ